MPASELLVIVACWTGVVLFPLALTGIFFAVTNKDIEMRKDGRHLAFVSLGTWAIVVSVALNILMLFGVPAPGPWR